MKKRLLNEKSNDLFLVGYFCNIWSARGKAESIITIELYESGNAKWTMEKYISQTKPEIKEWEAAIKSGRDISKYKNIAEFKDMISQFIRTAQNFSNGSMKIEKVNISYDTTENGSEGFGIVRYSFLWINVSVHTPAGVN